MTEHWVIVCVDEKDAANLRSYLHERMLQFSKSEAGFGEERRGELNAIALSFWFLDLRDAQLLGQIAESYCLGNRIRVTVKIFELEAQEGQEDG